MATETEKANVVRVKVSADEKVVGKQAEEANLIATDAQADLDKALPAMNSAVKALESLNKGDIGEMKGYKTPPDAVVKVLNAVLLLFGYPKKKQNWDEAKVLMTDSNFLNRCKTYDKDNIGEAMINSLKVFIEDEEFDPDYVRGKSSAAASLCMWVRAMDVYAKVCNNTPTHICPPGRWYWVIVCTFASSHYTFSDVLTNALSDVLTDAFIRVV